MSFRFFRYVGDKLKYQIVDVEVKKYSDGTQYRSLMLTDAYNKDDATIFPSKILSLPGLLQIGLTFVVKE